jgi:hypothetical protein
MQHSAFLHFYSPFPHYFSFLLFYYVARRDVLSFEVYSTDPPNIRVLFRDRHEHMQITFVEDEFHTRSFLS